MRVTRTYVDQPLAVGTTVELPDDVVAHLGRVLRLGDGALCTLFNGDGHDYSAQLVNMTKKSGQAQIESIESKPTESPLRITLIQGVARGEKMDWILQKATELGVTRIVPVLSQRGEVKLSGERADKRRQHWQEVVISACEQSGRAVIPVVEPVCELNALKTDVALALMLEPTASDRFTDLQAGIRDIALAIGPEGGWSEHDMRHLIERNFKGVRIGPRVLRTETAGLAAIAALQCQFGDF